MLSQASIARYLEDKGSRQPRNIAPKGTRIIGDLSQQQRRKEILLRLEAVRELARRTLLRFTEYTMEDYSADWFHKVLCRELDKFFDAVIAKQSPRLIICAPPRHGKTELVSRRFPAYALGKCPDLKIIATSYGSTLAADNNRDVQRIIDSLDYADLFPETVLCGMGVKGDDRYVRTTEAFEIVKRRGSYKNAGVLGPITGKGGNILILDDPVKDDADAHSETMREAAWKWFISTFMTRAEPGAGVLIIMTRWHEDDIVGRLLTKMEKGGEEWKVLSFPAIAEVDEDHRKTGEALCPTRYPLDALERIRRGSMDTNEVGVGSRVWDALYQQHPSSKAGEQFKRENWQYFRICDELGSMSPRERRRYLTRDLGVERLIQAWDTAIGSKEKNDFAACTTLGVTKNSYLVLDVWKNKIKYPEMRREIQLRYDEWIPDVVVIEGGGAAAGKAVIQDLDKDTCIPLKEIITSKDKELRADIVSPTHEAQRCYLPEGAGWVSSFVDTAAKFPHVKNDDDLDSWMLAMEEARTGTRMVQFSDEALAILGVR